MLFYDKNGGNMPEWCHKELLKKNFKQLLITGRIQKLFKSGRPLKAVRENVPLFFSRPF